MLDFSCVRFGSFATEPARTKIHQCPLFSKSDRSSHQSENDAKCQKRAFASGTIRSDEFYREGNRPLGGAMVGLPRDRTGGCAPLIHSPTRTNNTARQDLIDASAIKVYDLLAQVATRWRTVPPMQRRLQRTRQKSLALNPAINSDRPRRKNCFSHSFRRCARKFRKRGITVEDAPMLGIQINDDTVPRILVE